MPMVKMPAIGLSRMTARVSLALLPFDHAGCAPTRP